MRTNLYLTREEIQVEDLHLEKYTKVLCSLPDNNGMVTLFTKYWFKAPRKILTFLEKHT